MQIGFSSSSESKKCVICGKQTGNYKLYEQSNMVITIPAHAGDCYDRVDVKRIAARALTDIKNSIKG